MIVLDENLSDYYLLNQIKQWYPGKVIQVSTLRPQTIIKDEVIPTLLHQLASPTFITINTNDV